jgi:hypothetical protein
MTKLETRNPKEARNQKLGGFGTDDLSSGFVIRISFEFLVSDFGFID